MNIFDYKPSRWTKIKDYAQCYQYIKEYGLFKRLNNNWYLWSVYSRNPKRTESI